MMKAYLFHLVKIQLLKFILKIERVIFHINLQDWNIAWKQAHININVRNME